MSANLTITTVALSLALLGGWNATAASRHCSPPWCGLRHGAEFDTEARAQARCPADQVVWVRANQNRFVLRHTPGYGAGRGVFMCETDARQAGFRR